MTSIHYYFLTIGLTIFLAAIMTENSMANETEFSKFRVNLPQGWTGDETTGFISDNPEEYMLAFTKKNEAEDAVAAQVTLYLLPNKPQKNARDSALILAQAQGEATAPYQDGVFWTFKGEPRTNTLKGAGQTWVNSDRDYLLIIIAQDPDNLGAMELVKSLSGKSDEARKLLGQ